MRQTDEDRAMSAMLAAPGAAGTVAPANPTAWLLVEGKLYLNFDKPTQEQWKRDIPGNIEKADANWPRVLSA